MNTTTKSYERKGAIDSRDVDIVNAVEAIAPGTTPSRGIEIDRAQVIKADELEYEQFMRDELEVYVNEAQNENDPTFIEINVNGDYKMAMRGDTVKMRRYHVAVLAQAKQSRVRQTKIVNPDGSMGFREDNVLSLSYPFSVTMDPNPKRGSAWLKQMLSNPA